MPEDLHAYDWMTVKETLWFVSQFHPTWDTALQEESARRLESDISEAARVRSEALAEAEQAKLAAVKEAEDRIATAKRQAAAINERTQQEFSWRKQQLRRETELLHERKRAVLSQLASLSALAEETAHSFPDLEDPSDIENEGDHTVLRPAGLSPSLPGEQGPSGQPSPNGSGKENSQNEDPDNLEIDGDATVLVAASDQPAGTGHLAPGSDDKKKA